MSDVSVIASFDFELLWETLFLKTYNTRLVVVSVTLLGAAAGLIGSFLLLRKQSLLGDALSHATLPGIGIAFALMSALGMNAKSLPGLLAGATITGLLGVLLVLAIKRTTRLKEDACDGDRPLGLLRTRRRPFSAWSKKFPAKVPPDSSPSSTANPPP
jgi:hypothetical protein